MRRILLLVCAVASILLSALAVSRQLRNSEPFTEAFVVVALGYMAMLLVLILNRTRKVGIGLTIFSVLGFPVLFTLVISSLILVERYWYTQYP